MTEQEQPKKILLHVECLQGVGEITQAASLASQLLKQGLGVEVATSSGIKKFTEFEDKLSPEQKARFALHPLPTIALQNNSQELLQQRSELLLKHAQGTSRVIMASGWPMWLGDGILDTEMNALTHYTHKHNIPTSLLTREVMQGDSPMIEGGKQAVTTLFKENPQMNWIIMGDKHLTPLATSYDGADDIDARRIYYAGYGADTDKTMASNRPNTSKQPEKVIVNSGGGDVSHGPSSFHVLHAALVAAKNGTYPNAHWTIIAGEGHPEHKKQMLSDIASSLPNVDVVGTLPYDEFQEALKGNTVFIGELGVGVANDIIKNRTRAIIIPKTAEISTQLPNGKTHTAHFTEQRTRAKAFEAAGLIKAVYPDEQDILINEPILHEYDVNTLAAAISHEANFTHNLDTSAYGKLATNGYRHAAQAIKTNFIMPHSPNSPAAQR